MNKDLQTIKELIAEMKAQFSKSVETFEQATLTDGVTVIEYDALEVGMPVFVVADGERIPAPEGTHSLSGELAGVSIVVDAEGIITEVIDERVNEGDGEVAVEETSSDFQAISAEMLPQVLEDITEVIAERLGLEMGVAYDVATAVIAKINEETTMPVAESMSAEIVESIVNAKLEAFSKAVEGLAEMTKAIAENNTTLVNELSSLKSEFESFKGQPSVETKEAEKFSKVGNLTARQMFLKRNK
ncbi:hypothetical protein UFOVP775_41 [uncultured Caudovirales phage]|uniref:Uncharacterized protein n=1 Tax=uncultured Caudovirales phage TaxID=2100421 RepID=A0A6J5P4I8_9CAUD|nr:hypothetical protein UFOVP775_41 [uncultured Caudovirales phage]